MQKKENFKPVIKPMFETLQDEIYQSESKQAKGGKNMLWIYQRTYNHIMCNGVSITSLSLRNNLLFFAKHRLSATLPPVAPPRFCEELIVDIKAP